MKVSELQGAALDWAVAKCEGIEVVRWTGGALVEPSGLYFSPSTDWSYGGVVIQRENINIGKHTWDEDGVVNWGASKSSLFQGTPFSTGPTPLIAAMRCYVASQLGDEIELPEELK